MALKEELEQQGNWLFKRRGVLPVIILIAGAGMYLRMELYPETFFLANTAYEKYYVLGCLLISLFGLVIRAYTVGYSAPNTSGRNTDGQLADHLNTTGLYSIVRHPLYLGNFFMWTGPALMTGNLWFIIAFFFFYALYYERIMFAEEQFLRRQFGEVYVRWAASVPAILPRFRQFRRPAIAFNWKKVIKQEKNGLTAVFLIFSIFSLAAAIIEKQEDYDFILLACFALTLINHVVVKVLESRTQVLNERPVSHKILSA